MFRILIASYLVVAFVWQTRLFMLSYFLRSGIWRVNQRRGRTKPIEERNSHYEPTNNSQPTVSHTSVSHIRVDQSQNTTQSEFFGWIICLGSIYFSANYVPHSSWNWNSFDYVTITLVDITIVSGGAKWCVMCLWLTAHVNMINAFELLSF